MDTGDDPCGDKQSHRVDDQSQQDEHRVSSPFVMTDTSSQPQPSPARTACPSHGTRRLTSPQDRSAIRHGARGSLNVKVEPTPTWLVTPIFPPCNSTNLRQRANPRPVPSCFAALVPTCRNSSNTASWSSAAIPTPVSLTDTSTSPSRGTARTSIRPP